jgi:hypothetical protein
MCIDGIGQAAINDAIPQAYHGKIAVQIVPG